MKRAIVFLAAACLAACSGENGASPAATETGDAAAAKAKPSPSQTASDAPMTAERCIEENKGLGTGTRGEVTKDCLVGACDAGDKKSCKMVEGFAPEEGQPVDDAPVEE
jgi:hypothetical protein